MSSGPLVVLTGAGISKESGLDTFRDAGGIWSQVKIEDVATAEAFHRDPARVHDFYNARRARLQAASVQPNDAHRALARLEQAWPGEFLLVTQNVDDLHERAGSRQIVHMHGELLKARCAVCGLAMAWRAPITVASRCPSCRHEGKIRPHVVWFGEVPLDLPLIYSVLERATIFVAIGTSGSVYPAAGFVSDVRRRREARCVELNLDPSDGSRLFDERHYGPASQIVPAFVETLLGQLM